MTAPKTAERKLLDKKLKKLAGDLEKARWGSDQTAKLNSLKAYQELVGLDSPDELMERYIAATRSFNYFRDDRSDSPQERKAAVRAIKAWCEVFQEHIKHVNEQVQRDLEFAGQALLKAGRHPEVSVILREMKPHIDALEYKSKMAVELLRPVKDKDGARYTDTALNTLILNLAEIYKEATGKRAPISRTGPFFRFVLETLNALNCDYHSETSIGDKIKKLLEHRR